MSLYLSCLECMDCKGGITGVKRNKKSNKQCTVNPRYGTYGKVCRQTTWETLRFYRLQHSKVGVYKRKTLRTLDICKDSTTYTQQR